MVDWYFLPMAVGIGFIVAAIVLPYFGIAQLHDRLDDIERRIDNIGLGD